MLHIAVYWPMLTLRDAVRRRMPLARSKFATVRRSLLKIGRPAISRESAAASPV